MNRRFLPPLILFLATVGTAPAIGQLRDLIFKALPGAGPKFVLAVLGLIGALAMLWAVLQIREQRLWRYGGLALAAFLVWLQGVGFSADAASSAVEKVHILQYGLLALLLFRALVPEDGVLHPGLVLTILSTVTLCGIADETVQWFAPRRTGDIRDVGINALAGLTGLVFALSVLAPRRWSWRWSRHFTERRLAPVLALTVLAIGLFFAMAHLGYEIVDPEIGTFRSRYTAEELLLLSAERRQSWALNPPEGLPIWGIEDTFLTEAGWHMRHRNVSKRERWLPDFWAANRILEKYFAPYLDLGNFRGAGRQRLAPAARLRAQDTGHDPETYYSPAMKNRLYPWPKGPYFAVLFFLVAAVLLLPRFWRSKE